MLALVLGYALLVLIMLAASGWALWMLLRAPRSMQEARSRHATIASQEAEALQRFAAQCGGCYEAKDDVDAYGQTMPGPGTVVASHYGVTARVSYALSDTAGGDSYGEQRFLPQVLVELPEEATWVTTLPAIDFGRVRKRIGARPERPSFGRAFGLRAEALPPAAQSALWSLADDAFQMGSDSWWLLDVRMSPVDLVKFPLFLAPLAHGGYDVDALESFFQRVCILAAALMTSKPNH